MTAIQRFLEVLGIQGMVRCTAFALAIAASAAAWGQTSTPPATPTWSVDAAAGRMLYRDTPLLRGSQQACVQCHANAALQVRGITLNDQQDHIRCAIQGGCGGATMAVYPFGNMAQFQGRLDSTDIRQLASYIRQSDVRAPYPRLNSTAPGTLSVAIGRQATRSFVLENLGELPFAVATTQLTGDAGVSVDANTCTAGRSLQPGQRCELSLRFAPSCELPLAARLHIAHDGPMLGSELRLGALATGSSQPTARFEPTELRFDAWAARAVTLTNSCGGDLAVSQISASGGFRLAQGPGTCDGRAIKAGQSCQIWVEPMPGSAQAGAQGELLVWHSANGSAQRITLAGIPDAPLQVNALQARPEGEVTLGQRQNWAVAQLRNAQSVTQTLASIASSNREFSVAASQPSACTVGQTLPAGGSCSLWLSFEPSTSGQRSATLTVSGASGLTLATWVVGAAATVATVASPPPSSGGGAMDGSIAVLALLWAFAAMRNRRRRG